MYKVSETTLSDLDSYFRKICNDYSSCPAKLANDVVGSKCRTVYRRLNLVDNSASSQEIRVRLNLTPSDNASRTRRRLLLSCHPDKAPSEGARRLSKT